MRGWRWIPIHLPFSPSSLFFIILQTFYLSRAFTILVLVSYHPLLTRARVKVKEKRYAIKVMKVDSVGRS